MVSGDDYNFSFTYRNRVTSIFLINLGLCSPDRRFAKLLGMVKSVFPVNLNFLLSSLKKVIYKSQIKDLYLLYSITNKSVSVTYLTSLLILHYFSLKR